MSPGPCAAPRAARWVRGTQRPGLVMLAGITLVCAGCGGGSGVPTTAATSTAPTTTGTAPSPIASLATECHTGTAGFRRTVLRTADGVRLAAAESGSGATAVILVHQADTTLCDWLPYARRLRAQARVLALDLRGYGASDGAVERAAIGRFDRDVAAAVRRVRREGARRVVLIGASMGGAVVLSAAGRIHPTVSAVVSLSAPAEWPDITPGRAARRLRIPLILAAGAQDSGFAQDARTLARLAAANPRARLVILDSAHHGVQLVDGRDAQASRIDGLIRSTIASVAG
ncbi:MAG: alpha/beta fold hydrolase [Thermoleophilia bacterium]